MDLERAVKIAIVHDVAEARIGDIAKRAIDAEPELDEREKEMLEQKTIKEFSRDLEIELNSLWKEYLDRQTPEARFVKDMDLVDMCLQALKYEKDNRYDPEKENDNFKEYDNMDEFFATAGARLRTETGERFFEKIKERYEKAKQE